MYSLIFGWEITVVFADKAFLEMRFKMSSGCDALLIEINLLRPEAQN